MSQTAVEFIVANLVELDDGRFMVVGRNGHAPIEVGDRFDVIHRYRPCREIADYEREPMLETEREVSLRVVEIIVFREPSASISGGMTGALVIDGEGMEDIGPHCVLGRRTEFGGEPARSTPEFAVGSTSTAGNGP